MRKRRDGGGRIDRAWFEHMLARRASRRGMFAGGLGAAALTTSVSLAGRPTRSLAHRQATPGASPIASPIGTPGPSGTPFALGVASGDPLPGSVVLWTRLAPDPTAEDGLGGMEPSPVEVAWEVATDERFGQVVANGTVDAAPELGHSVHVDAVGLEPSTEYFYRFIAGGEASPIGRTKTAPAAGASVDAVRFAFASCSHWEHGWFSGYRGIAGEDLDLILHLGDYIYEYPTGADFLPSSGVIVRKHLGGEVVSLADYRRRHAQYKTDPDLQAAHAAAPWVVTWDDHETENNYAGDTSENGDPVAAFLERRANAYQAYYENMPLRPESMPQGPDMTLYRRLTYGSLAEFQVLDTRQYRADQPCDDGVVPRCAAALDPEATMTGPEQERWLLDGLTASGATWNVIAQQVMMGQLNTDPSAEGAYVMDLWDGYPAARNRILAHLMAAGVANPVVLTGDIHSTWVNDLKADFADPSSATVGTEFVVTSITADNPFGPRLSALLPLNPHIRYYDYLHGYSRCEVTPDRWTTEVVTVPDATDSDALPSVTATFVVEAGAPGALPG